MPAIFKSFAARSGFAIGSRLSLATKLYSIFALFALLTAAITALSDYNTRRSTELTEAIETARKTGSSNSSPRLARTGAYRVSHACP
jgi:methyl-accepting chemotaxis protein